MTLTVQKVNLEGVTALDPAQIAAIYQQDLGKEIPLARLWDWAARISEIYQKEGYFLSRAYVPAQEVESGTVILRVVEGYIAEVEIQGLAKGNAVAARLTRTLTAMRPARITPLENALLLLNDIPGLRFEAVLSRLKQTPEEEETAEGGAKLILKGVKSAGRVLVSSTNHGSRFAGTHMGNVQIEQSFAPGHVTSVSGLNSLPAGKDLSALTLAHRLALYPGVEGALTFSRTVSEPGYTLAASEIDSRSIGWDATLRWRALRTRDKNLTLGLGFSANSVETDTLGAPLTRDKIRALRLSALYDRPDAWQGRNTINASLSQGLDVFNATPSSDPNISRAGANPGFTKAEATWQRSQLLSRNWQGMTTLTGQIASGSLYSSEEFGVGGPSLGRAYDSSEITGDHGLAAGFQAYYIALPRRYGLRVMPSAFADIGKVWNEGTGQTSHDSLASLGGGLDIEHESGFRAAMTLAQPLIKKIDAPAYGWGARSPRLFVQIGKEF